ncbi:hypothetical protein [Burkholderia ubonensis]|uniref:hypothetical protein n=1 Tax=Burkholderia ubonensis TaxID=101571 RepID=UPI00075E3E95|nr:hypothetical protein [Burkholderia ubonensis]KVW61211.1 hypothetical protein WK99_15900 [Burkholderia ubonensis]
MFDFNVSIDRLSQDHQQAVKARAQHVSRLLRPGRSPLEWQPSSLREVTRVLSLLRATAIAVDDTLIDGFADFVLEVARHRYGGMYALEQHGDHDTLIISMQQRTVSFCAWYHVQGLLMSAEFEPLEDFYDRVGEAVRGQGVTVVF